jgi:hypothetical protein
VACLGSGKGLPVNWDTAENRAAVKKAFPRLRNGRFRIVGPPSCVYNSFALAAGDRSAWWTPDPEPGSYWPPNTAHPNFNHLFDAIGYKGTTRRRRQAGYDLVAVFAMNLSLITHAARQLPSGMWMIKLGEWFEIEVRSLRDLKNDAFGDIGPDYYEKPLRSGDELVEESWLAWLRSQLSPRFSSREAR